MKKVFYFIPFIVATCIVGCKPEQLTPPEEDINLGGETSVSGSFILMFQQPAANLSSTEISRHFDSDGVFGAKFVTAPSTINSGLGPLFNQNSCESCHLGNGRSPFPHNSTDLKGLLFRISLSGSIGLHGEHLPVPDFGNQIQNKATFGVLPEAQLSIQEIDEVVSYIDGTQITLKRPIFTFVNPYMSIPSNIQVSPRIAPPVIGLGLLEAITEADIIALADENDVDGDGISGKPNYVWDVRQQLTTLGRFGWKAAQPNLYQQNAAAYSGDMGVTSPIFVLENCAGQIQDDGLSDDAEVDDETVKLATFYTQSLAVPQRRNYEDPDVIKGKALFKDLKCATCHHPKFVTGQHEHGFLSYQTIFPYTDMLLHDMGSRLADNRPDFAASGTEWRTPPLWGIGLTQMVGGHTDFLHDGRAHSLEEAILWHGGEAENSKETFRALSKKDRDAVIAFLNSL